MHAYTIIQVFLISEQYIQDGNKLCCAGRLKTKKQEADASCCGQELIDNDEEVCCNDKILAKGYQCCHTTYDSEWNIHEQSSMETL